MSPRSSAEDPKVSALRACRWPIEVRRSLRDQGGTHLRRGGIGERDTLPTRVGRLSYSSTHPTRATPTTVGATIMGRPRPRSGTGHDQWCAATGRAGSVRTSAMVSQSTHS